MSRRKQSSLINSLELDVLGAAAREGRQKHQRQKITFVPETIYSFVEGIGCPPHQRVLFGRVSFSTTEKSIRLRKRSMRSTATFTRSPSLKDFPNRRPTKQTGRSRNQ